MRYLDKCFENDRVKSDLQDEIYKVNTRQARTTANLCEEIMRICDERFEDIDDAHESIRDMYASARDIKGLIDEARNIYMVDTSVYYFYDPVPCTTFWVKYEDESERMDILDSDLKFLGC